MATRVVYARRSTFYLKKKKKMCDRVWGVSKWNLSFRTRDVLFLYDFNQRSELFLNELISACHRVTLAAKKAVNQS
jgi:hypothetical protein